MPLTRLRSSEFTEETLTRLAEVLEQSGEVALTDTEGHRIELPAPLVRHLLLLVQLMQQKRTLVLIPEDETLTTQAAANYLGVSRQHLVNLLERGEIPFHKVGTHRRVYFRDLLTYEKRRDRNRHEALNRLMQAVDEAGLYDASYTGEA